MYICYICRFKTYTYIRRASTCINFPLKVVVAVPPPLPPPTPPPPPPPESHIRVIFTDKTVFNSNLLKNNPRNNTCTSPYYWAIVFYLFTYLYLYSNLLICIFTWYLKCYAVLVCWWHMERKKRKDKREGMENMIFHYLLYLIEISSKTQ